MSVVILGAGLAGLSLANYLKQKSTILEREARIGGLCRSFSFCGVRYDIGPHILFSRKKESLNRITSLLETNVIRRSNVIFHRNRFVKYPFENHLYALDKDEREYCLNEFLNNPYEKYDAKNMLQFFLKTFGEGITRLYLQPYNEKIWKFDPSFMDTQMVERIPKPPKEDIINSANGKPSEGYTHQLYFHYPKSGGIEHVIERFSSAARQKADIVNPVEIERIEKSKDGWSVLTDRGTFKGKDIVNCMPVHELFNYLDDVPARVRNALRNLKYNSIHIVAVLARNDSMGDNFVATFADKKLIFHRISKISFLGDSYRTGKGSVIIAEITYRKESHIGRMDRESIKRAVIEGLDSTGIVKKEDVLKTEIRSFEYAYVIYDLEHRRNTDMVLEYLSSRGIHSCGRFAEFEYLNMDAVVERAYSLARKLNGEA